MADVMIDLETMGTSRDAAIVSIGAVWFNPYERWIKQPGFYERIDLVSSCETWGVIEPSTVLWWLKQSEEARREVYAGGRDVIDVLFEFQMWLESQPIDRVWSHGKEFDIEIVERVFERSFVKTPWKYQQTRDTRTIFDVAGIEYKGTAHHALKDATAQA